MKPFFDSPDKIDQLASAAISWIGTPFRPHGRVKGPQGGASCQSFVAALYIECGISPESVDTPKTSLRKFRATHSSEVAAWVDKSPCFSPVPVSEVQPGDLLLFLYPDYEHCGVMLKNGEIAHCQMRIGVSINLLEDASYGPHLARVWRLCIEEP